MKPTSKALANTTGTLLSPQLDYILVDGSGSMSDKWWEFNASLEAMRSTLLDLNTNSHLIVTVFDSHDLNLRQRDCRLADSPTFAAEPLVAHWGGTPLYDAINLMSRQLRDLDPEKCSVVIVTDGHENGSDHTDATQAGALIEWMRAKGWQVTFIGCDFNNARQARALGVNETNAIGVQKKLLSDATKNFARKRAAYGHYGTDINFTEEERQQFGGLLGYTPAEDK